MVETEKPLQQHLIQNPPAPYTAHPKMTRNGLLWEKATWSLESQTLIANTWWLKLHSQKRARLLKQALRYGVEWYRKMDEKETATIRWNLEC
jgi:hypothetical protein